MIREINESGFDILGAVSLGEYLGVSSTVTSKAQAAGQRAVAAAKRIAKHAPRLSASIAKAGQRALSLGVKTAKAVAKPAAQQPRVSSPAARGGVVTPPARTRTMPSRRTMTHMGDDTTDQQANAYADLADAASRIADFIGMLQDLMAQLPTSSPLVVKIQNSIDSFGFFFGTPIDDAVNGARPVDDAVASLVQTLNALLDQQNDTIPTGVWELVAQANTYLQTHGSAPAGGPTMTMTVRDHAAAAASAAVTGTPVPGAVPASGVAKVIVTPPNIIMVPGQPQQFYAQAVDASGKGVVPAPALQWSVTPTMGAMIDQTGLLAAQGAGNFTVTATAGSVAGTAVATVQSAGDAGAYGGGGGGGGGNGDSGGDGGDGGGGGDDGGSAGDDSAPQDDAPTTAIDMQQEQQDDGSGDMPPDDSDDSSDGLSLMGATEIGGGGGHGGGGHGGHGGHGGGRRGGRGGWGWWGGPWVYGDEIDYDFYALDEEPTVDDVAKAVVKHLKKQSGKTVVGGFDLGTARHQMDALKQVPVGVALILLRRGQTAITTAMANAKQPWYRADLPGDTARKDVEGHLQWHANALKAVAGDPQTTMYVSADDLKKWVLQAFIEQNASEEGAATADKVLGQAWGDYGAMWAEIGKFVATLPTKVIQAVGGLIKTGIESILGVPIWVLVFGGFILTGLLGYGVYRIVRGPAGHAIVRRLTR